MGKNLFNSIILSSLKIKEKYNFLNSRQRRLGKYKERCFYYIFFPVIKYRKSEKIGIIGCGRSGTKYVSELFMNQNKVVLHECLGLNGISSWCLVPKTYERHFGPSYFELEELGIPLVHQVRHPLKVISSVKTFGNKSWEFISKFIPVKKSDSIILKGMKYWYYWNKMAEKRSIYTYRVENIDIHLEKIFEIGRFKIPVNFTELLDTTSRNVNTRNPNTLTWNDLENEDIELTKRIKHLARKYGYKI